MSSCGQRESDYFIFEYIWVLPMFMIPLNLFLHFKLFEVSSHEFKPQLAAESRSLFRLVGIPQFLFKSEKASI